MKASGGSGELDTKVAISQNAVDEEVIELFNTFDLLEEYRNVWESCKNLRTTYNTYKKWSRLYSTTEFKKYTKALMFFIRTWESW